MRNIATTPRPTPSQLATTQGEHVPPGLVCPALDDLINKSLITAHTEYYTLTPIGHSQLDTAHDATPDPSDDTDSFLV